MKLQYGARPDIRDRLLEILSDGKERHISEIIKELNWPKSTNVSKTLVQIKARLVMTKDERRLHRITFDNHRKGTIWYLTHKNQNEEDSRPARNPTGHQPERRAYHMGDL